MKIRTVVIILVIVVMVSLIDLQADVRQPDTRLQGRVLSSTGQPVVQAEVRLDNFERSSYTNEEGIFVLDVPAGSNRIKLIISHPDYFEQDFLVNLTAEAKILKFVVNPYISQKEEVVVTATRFPEPVTSVPAASSVLTAATIEEQLPAQVTEVIQNTAGVSTLGTGGFSVVPSIRGLARRRVLLLIDNARLSSDRRTGPNASFLNPEDIQKVEILRSASSVYYGSDAIGGVINYLTHMPQPEEPLRVRGYLKYGTVNNEREVNLSFSGAGQSYGYYFSVRDDQADNYQSPSSEIPCSYFGQSSFLGKIIKYSDKREISASFLLGRGQNIGKPAINSDSKPTWYPAENQNLFQFNWKEKSFGPKALLNFHLYINPNYMETRTDKIDNSVKTQESYARTESTDFGLQLSCEFRLLSGLRLTTGADLIGRADSQAYNQYINFDDYGQINEIIDEYPYTRGRRLDSGLFLTLDFSMIKKLDITGGWRYDWLYSRAETGGEDLSTRDHSLTGFLAASYQLFQNVSLFANYSRAYRTPDINEKFYTGITGRGFIIANPQLKNESSQNFDAGVKISGSRMFLGIYGFVYNIDNLIERYLIGSQLYTYGNVEQGKIKGVELEAEYFPWSRLSFFGNYFLYDGQSKVTGGPLNDIPSPRLFIGGRAWLSRLTLEISLLYQAKKDEPGPAEIAIPDYSLVNLRASYRLNRALKINLRVNNLFNKWYLARPDPDSREEPGRNFLLGLSFSY